MGADYTHYGHVRFHDFLPNTPTDIGLISCFKLPHAHIGNVRVHHAAINGGDVHWRKHAVVHNVYSSVDNREYIVGACDSNNNLIMVKLNLFRNIYNHHQGCAWVSESRGYDFNTDPYQHHCQTSHLYSHWNGPHWTYNVASTIYDHGWNIDYLDLYAVPRF